MPRPQRLVLALTILLVLVSLVILDPLGLRRIDAPQSEPTPDLPAVQTRTGVVEATQPATGARVAVDHTPHDVGHTRENTHLLRVFLGGVPEAEARRATVSVKGHAEFNRWPAELTASWPAQGPTSTFELSAFLARVADHQSAPDLSDLEIEIDHPHHLPERVRVSLADGIEEAPGQTVHEVRAELAGVTLWPDFTLTVRDAASRMHLRGIELRCVPTAFMGTWQRPGLGEPFTLLGEGLQSPIALLGGRKANQAEDEVAGLGFRTADGRPPELAALFQPEATDRGILVYARAPGYAWGRLVVDVTTGTGRELRLVPATTLGVRVTNLQPELYERYGAEATLCVWKVDPVEDEERVWFESLDAREQAHPVWLEGLEPGVFRISVELGGAFSWTKRPVLANASVTLEAGQRRELELALEDPPPPRPRASLSGLLTLPAFEGEERAELQLFDAATHLYGGTETVARLGDLQRRGGALRTWEFRFADLPSGRYQAHLWPLQKSWMVDLPAEGRDDVELGIEELSEVLVETVDARSGARVPLETIRFRSREELPGQVHQQWIEVSFDDEPGRFRFLAAPGAASVGTSAIPDGLAFGHQQQDLELSPDRQSFRFELRPFCAIRFLFRVDGAALPRDDDIWVGMSKRIRAVGHDGAVSANRLPSDRLVELSRPGVYEVRFEGIGSERFLPIPSRTVDVRAGETVEVLIDLRRR